MAPWCRGAVHNALHCPFARIGDLSHPHDKKTGLQQVGLAVVGEKNCRSSPVQLDTFQ